MNIQAITMEKESVRKLLSAASGDTALLYLYLHSGNDLAQAARDLGLTESKVACALATLRQLELWQQEKRPAFVVGERPEYREQDVLRTMDTDPSFRSLYGEIQRRLGRALTTEELKIVLGFVHYLGLPADVICVLVSFCQDRARQRGSLRNPSLRMIEKEAYFWAENGIDTMEAAAAYIHRQNIRNSRMGALLALLQIRGRSLTAAEEKYAQQWLEMGMDDELIALAYERTCLNTGGLNWAYMHKILLRWKEAGLRTVQDVKNGDAKRPAGGRGLDSDEQAAIARLLQEV